MAQFCISFPPPSYKELFEQLMRDHLKRTISPRDFERIGERASTRQLEECQSFKVIADALRLWFV